MVNYQEAFEKPFTDIKKLAIGILLSIFPVINWFAKGFILECSGVGRTKPGKKMPEWKGFLDLFVKGFISLIISIIYLLPAILLLALSAGTVLLGVISSLTLEQLQSNQAASLVSSAIQSSWPSIVAVIPFILISILLMLLAVYITPIAVLSYLSEKKFSAAFNCRKICSKTFSWNYLFAWLFVILAYFLLSFLTFIPFVGNGIASFISGVIAYSLFGQVFLESKKK